MEFDATFFAIALPAAFIAGVAKGGFGGGPAFVATALLAIVIPPDMALGIMLPLLMVADLVTLRPFWRQWSWPHARFLIYGGAVGVFLGTLLYRVSDPDLLRLLIGVIAWLFVLYQLARFLRPSQELRSRHIREPRATPGLFAGFATGFSSFVSHAGGPPAAIYLLNAGLGKTAFQATMVLAFWAVNGMKAVPYAFLGVFSWQSFVADLYLVGPLLLGCAVGVFAHRVVPERWFFVLTSVLLLGSGTKLIFDALS